jgi:hypothetical protein
MARTVRAFDYDIDFQGAHVTVRRVPLCAGCVSDDEIDTNIRLLKEDLDAVAKRMKAAIHEGAVRGADR